MWTMVYRALEQFVSAKHVCFCEDCRVSYKEGGGGGVVVERVVVERVVVETERASKIRW